MKNIDWIGSLRWCRDQLAARIATFWMIAAFYALGIGLVLAFFQIDAEFSRPLAGGVVPPEVTQHLAWAVRVFSVIVGMAAMYCHVNNMPRFRNMMGVLGGVAAVLLFLHALGISAKIMEGQYGRAAAIGEIETATTGSAATQIAVLQAQIDGIRADRDGQVDRLQASINGIVNDGLNNDELADAYRADQVAAEDDARSRIRPLEDQITALTLKSGETVVKATEDKTQVDSFNPLFTFLARVFSWTWNPATMPSDTLQFGLGFAFLTLFFGFGEVLMMACFTVAYGMQLVVAKRREVIDLGTSADVPDGHVRVEIPQEEWDAMQEAMRVHGNIKQGARKGATTRRRGNKIEAADDYYRDKIAGWMVAHNNGIATSTIANTSGLTVAQMRMTYGPYMTEEERAALFFTQAPEPPVAVADSPQDDDAQSDAFEADPVEDAGNSADSQDYPVAPYEPPANDEPDGKEAA